MDTGVELRALTRAELTRVAEIDRRERIDLLYEQRGICLVERHGRWDAPAWEREGGGEHSVAGQVRALEHHLGAGGVALGTFVDGSLVGVGLVVPHLRPRIAQLAYLHVSAPFRAKGIGTRLFERLEQIARGAGDLHFVVSATPSENTVRFYRDRGFEPMADPLPELYEAEPDDIHMHRPL